MDTFNDLQDLALHVLLFSALCCISIVKRTIREFQPSHNDLLISTLAPNNEWSEQEISDLVDYLFHHLSTDPGGSSQPGTYENLAIHLAQRHPGFNRTVEAIRSKFNSLKETVTTIDHYNKIFGNSPKHDNILITPLDQEALNLHLKSAQGKALSALMLYCNNPFPHYHKLKGLMGQVAGSSEAEHHSNIANVVQCMEGLVIGSHFPTTQLLSQPPQALSESALSGNTLSSTPWTSSTPSTQLFHPQAFSSSSACGFEPECHAFYHSPMPPLRPSSASNHGLQQPYPSAASAWGTHPSAPDTPSSTLPSQQHPASSYVSRSQRPDKVNQTIQMPLGLEHHPRNYQSSTSFTRGRIGYDPAIDDCSSHLSPEIEGSSSAALVGVAGVVSNFRPPYAATREAVKFVAAECSLSEEERAFLCIYYGKNMTEAAALSLMGGSLRRAVFRKVLEGLPSEFCIGFKDDSVQ